MDISLVKSMLGDEDLYKAFVACEGDEQYLDYDQVTRDDEWAKNELTKCLNISSGTVLQKYSKIDRDTALARLKKRGLSIRQIERLTGINRNTIQRAR